MAVLGTTEPVAFLQVMHSLHLFRLAMTHMKATASEEHMAKEKHAAAKVIVATRMASSEVLPVEIKIEAGQAFDISMDTSFCTNSRNMKV